MNTLALLSADIALLWLSIYAFTRLGEAALGVAVLGMFLAFVTLNVVAIKDDADILGGGGRDDE